MYTCIFVAFFLSRIDFNSSICLPHLVNTTSGISPYERSKFHSLTVPTAFATAFGREGSEHSHRLILGFSVLHYRDAALAYGIGNMVVLECLYSI